LVKAEQNITEQVKRKISLTNAVSQDRAGQDRIDLDRTEKDRTGYERDSTGKDRAEQSTT
jgi:hypothetical protein